MSWFPVTFTTCSESENQGDGELLTHLTQPTACATTRPILQMMGGATSANTRVHTTPVSPTSSTVTALLTRCG